MTNSARVLVASFLINLMACATDDADATLLSGASASAITERPAPPPYKGSCKARPTSHGWTWFDCPETRCVDGSSTGFAVRGRVDAVQAAKQVFVFLQEGGACFNATSCAVSHDYRNFDYQKWEKLLQSGALAGIFDQDHPNNPVREWTPLFVPYCSGDVFAGSKTPHSGYSDPIHEVLSKGVNQYHGYEIVGEAVTWLKSNTARMQHLGLFGRSAGAFGTYFNADRLRKAFPEVKMTVLSDSAPPFADAKLGILPGIFRKTWNLDATLPSDCVGCRATGSNPPLVTPLYDYLLSNHNDVNFGLISTDHDEVIRKFYAFGNHPFALAPKPLDGLSRDEYCDGLRGIINFTAPYGNATTFVMPGTRHMWISDADLFSVQGGVLVQWIAALIAQDTVPNNHVSPGACPDQTAGAKG